MSVVALLLALESCWGKGFIGTRMYIPSTIARPLGPGLAKPNGLE
jgi:hypothetical protein